MSLNLIAVLSSIITKPKTALNESSCMNKMHLTSMKCTRFPLWPPTLPLVELSLWQYMVCFLFNIINNTIACALTFAYRWTGFLYK